MDLRTFLPPPALPVSPPPRTGAPAPELPVEPDGRPLVLAFLRHAGCPFAEATLRELRGHADRHSGVRFVAVSHAPEGATAAWCEAVGGSGPVEVACDPDRRLYAAWGLGRSTLGHFAGRRSLAAVAGLARQGIRNRHPSGSRWQTAGTFAVDAGGTVRFAHVPGHAGDLPDLAGAVAAAQGARGTAGQSPPSGSG